MDTNNSVPNTYQVAPVKSNTVYYLLFGIVIMAFLAVGGILFFNKDKVLPNNSGASISSVKITESPIVKKVFQGKLTLKSMGGGVVEVWADAQGADIISYDVLISYDKNSTELLKTETSLSDFSTLNQDLVSGVAITGFRSPSSIINHNWQGIKILTLTFKAKVKTTAQVVEQIGKRTSKFIDKQTKAYYPEGSSIGISQ